MEYKNPDNIREYLKIGKRINRNISPKQKFFMDSFVNSVNSDQNMTKDIIFGTKIMSDSFNSVSETYNLLKTCVEIFRKNKDQQNINLIKKILRHEKEIIEEKVEIIHEIFESGPEGDHLFKLSYHQENKYGILQTLSYRVKLILDLDKLRN